MTADIFDKLNSKSLESSDDSDYEPKRKNSNDIFEQIPIDESWWKSAARTLLQVPKGMAGATTYGIATGLGSLIAQGESLGELEELKERLPELKKKFPQLDWPEEIDEEKYMEALQNAYETFPTVHNIANKIEENTGIPLEAKTRLQKGVEFASGAGKLAPKGATLRPLNVSLPKPVLGVGVEATREALIEGGLPEPLADIASFLVLKQPGAGAGELSIGAKTKPSGMKERQFENVTSPKEVSPKKLAQVNKTIEKDFKEISDKIITDSPVGETAKNLAENPTYKLESRELLEEAQNIANSMKETIEGSSLKKEFIDVAAKSRKGFAPNEYDKSYMRLLKEAADDLPNGKVSAGRLVEQYRKNNASLSEYFEPGSSKAHNRAKRDVLLDQNRAIASSMEKSFPESELVPVFKEGNARWTKIRDAETIDEFVSNIFGEKVNHKKAEAVFDDPNTRRIFQRALGDEGFKEFEQLTKDFLTTEKPYKLLKVAENQGYQQLAKTMMTYFLHPKIGMAKAGYDVLKGGYKMTTNMLLTKPKFGVKYRQAMKDFRKADFKAAEKEFEMLKGEIEAESEKASKSITHHPETIDVAAEKIPEKPSVEETKEAFKKYRSNRKL